MKFHYLENIQVVEKAHYHKSGRPSKDKSPSRLTYHLQANLAVNTQALTVSQNKAGRFILATNLVDTTQWTHSNVLQEYYVDLTCGMSVKNSIGTFCWV